jgi:excisionase family DNA binding protein
MAERMLTVKEVAERARVSEKTVRRWLQSGRLRGRMLGGTKIGYRISESEFERFLQAPPVPTDQSSA